MLINYSPVFPTVHHNTEYSDHWSIQIVNIGIDVVLIKCTQFVPSLLYSQISPSFDNVQDKIPTVLLISFLERISSTN